MYWEESLFVPVLDGCAKPQIKLWLTLLGSLVLYTTFLTLSALSGSIYCLQSNNMNFDFDFTVLLLGKCTKDQKWYVYHHICSLEYLHQTLSTYANSQEGTLSTQLVNCSLRKGTETDFDPLLFSSWAFWIANKFRNFWSANVVFL